MIYTTKNSIQLRGPQSRRLLATFTILPLIFTSSLHAAKLVPSAGADAFAPAAISGDTAVVGAYGIHANGYARSGALYLYLALNEVDGTQPVSQSIRLVPSDAGAQAYVGRSVALSGNTVLVGAIGAVEGMRGAAYLYRNVNEATGLEDAKLVASSSARNTYLGFSSALSANGETAVLGGYGATVGGKVSAGAVYVYRGLETASGEKFENAVLAASDAEANAQFGYAVALSSNGGTALVGANTATVGSSPRAGAAYLFHNLGAVDGTIENPSAQSAKLVASDAAANMLFGNSVTLGEDGGTAIVGAHQAANGSLVHVGAVYVYRDLESASGTKTENAKLLPSDALAWSHFGNSVSMSGSTALVGARNGKMHGFTTGTAYLYLDVNTEAPIITEDVKIAASDAAEYFAFGHTVSLAGDNFVVGACTTATGDIVHGRAYTANVSAITTLNAGDTVKLINGISFKSQRDWIVGEDTSENVIVLGWGDTAMVNNGRVSIGKTNAAANNMLIIDGKLVADQVYIGTSENAGNMLQIGEYADISKLGAIFLNGGNELVIDQAWNEKVELFDLLGGTELWAWDGGAFVLLDSGNFLNYVRVDHGDADGLPCMIISLVGQSTEPVKITDMRVSGNFVTLGGELWSAVADEIPDKWTTGDRIRKRGYYAIFSAPELSEAAVWTFTQYSGDIGSDGTFSDTFDMESGADERFYRVATSNLPFDENGETKGALHYSWNIGGYYTLRAYAGQTMFRVNQLEQTAANGNTVASLFPGASLSGISVTINVYDGGVDPVDRMVKGGEANWGLYANRRIAQGRPFHVISSADYSQVIAGVVNSGSYTRAIPSGTTTPFASVLPLSCVSKDIGLKLERNAVIVLRRSDGNNDKFTVEGSLLNPSWGAKGDPFIKMGEHFDLLYPASGKTLVQQLYIDINEMRKTLSHTATADVEGVELNCYTQ